MAKSDLVGCSPRAISPCDGYPVAGRGRTRIESLYPVVPKIGRIYISLLVYEYFFNAIELVGPCAHAVATCHRYPGDRVRGEFLYTAVPVIGYIHISFCVEEDAAWT